MTPVVQGLPLPRVEFVATTPSYEEDFVVPRPTLPTAAELGLPLPFPVEFGDDALLEEAAFAGFPGDDTMVGNPFTVDHVTDIASAFAGAAAAFAQASAAAVVPKASKPNKPSLAKRLKAMAKNLPKGVFPDPATDPILWVAVKRLGTHVVSRGVNTADPAPATGGAGTATSSRPSRVTGGKSMVLRSHTDGTAAKLAKTSP